MLQAVNDTVHLTKNPNFWINWNKIKQNKQNNKKYKNNKIQV